MIQRKLKGVWLVIKGKFKQHFNNDDDEGIKQTIGQADELVGWLQISTGKSKKEVVDFINNSIITNKKT